MTTPLSLTDADAEALLEGADEVKSGLADIAEVVAAIRVMGSHDLDKDYTGLIAAAALESRATPVARYAAEQDAVSSTPRDWSARVVPRVAIGAAALFMLLVSSAGLAYAANGAKPGDMLYGLDRAAEAIGILDGGPNERYEEAQALITAGEVPGGLALATEILDRTPGGEDATPAVAEAATRLEEEPAEPDSQVAEQVSDLLGYIHEATITGVVDTNTVSDLAQQIGGPPGGIPPGLDGEDPGGSGEAPGHTGENPGQGGGGDPAIESEDPAGPPGQEGTAPGLDPDGPGNSENAPGQNEEEEETVEEADGGPGSSDEAPGQNEEDPPGNSEDAPGQSEDPPGPPTSIPGRGTPGGG